MKRIAPALLFLFLVPVFALAGNDAGSGSETGITPVGTSKVENIKTGWNVGLIPAFNYNAEMGFMSGAIGQVYNYGDGTIYPNYYNKFNVLASIYSKGAKQLSVDYDAKNLLPGKRMKAGFEFIDNPLGGFYGFNGAVSPYYADLDLRKSSDGSEGIAFYANHQKRIGVNLDLQGGIMENLTWTGGLNYSYQEYSDVALKVFDGTETLFHQYVETGLIPDEELYGHRVELKGGIVIDSRDLESNPARGLFATATLTGGISHSFSTEASLLLTLDLRHYVPIVPSRLTFAYQLAYKGLVAGSLPFYALPGFTIRGAFGNRIAGSGSGVAWASADLRWKLAGFRAFKQNFEVGLVGFADAGAVVQPYRLAEQRLLGNYSAAKTLDGTTSGPYRSVYDPDVATKERVHASVGGGFFFSKNHNFIVAFELGRPLNPLDGSMGLLINMGFSF